jgi:hypothetical protein
VVVASQNWEVARVAGFDIRIQPRANLVPARAYGFPRWYLDRPQSFVS